MPLYRYRAIDTYGEPLEGTMEESSAFRVTQILEERGAQVNLVEEVETAPRALGRGPRSLSWEDVSLINSQLLAITRAGIPVSASLNALAKDMENKRLRPVFESLQRDLESGLPLDACIARSPSRFPPIYVSLVRAGERSGNVPGVLQMIADYSTRILDLRDRVFAASIYPVYVIISALLVLGVSLGRIVPEYVDVYEDFGGSLPAPTRLLVRISDLFRDYGTLLLTGIVVLSIVTLLSASRLRHGEGRAFLDRVREWIPVIGRTFRFVTIARFSKALGMLLQARVPIEESLDLASAASGNEQLRAKVRQATVHIAQGEKVAEAFLDTRYFPHSYLWFLANGESRGQLPQTLIDVSETYEREITARDTALLNLMLPVTILLLGVFVSFMVVALYLPVFTLGDAISG